MGKIKNNSQGRKRNSFKRSVIFFIPVLLVLIGGTLAFGVPGQESNKQVLEKAFKIQMPFIENQGQISDEHVRFYAKTFGGALYVTDKGEMVYSFTLVEPKSEQKRKYSRRPSNNEIIKSWTLKEKLVGNLSPVLQGMDESKAKANYFIGNDQKKWKTNINTYNSCKPWRGL